MTQSTAPTRYHCGSMTHRTSPDSVWPLRRADGRTWIEAKAEQQKADASPASRKPKRSRPKAPRIWCDHCNAEIRLANVRACLRQTCATKALLLERDRQTKGLTP